MIVDKNKKIPTGLVTVVFVCVALLVVGLEKLWPVDACDALKQEMGQGYFMQWMGTELLVVTADKQQFKVEAETQSQACEAFRKTLRAAE